MTMRSALYYPHTELRSSFLLSTCLLLWDKVQFITPYQSYRPAYRNKDMARAIEIIGEQHYPTDQQKEQAHNFIEDFVTQPLPEAFTYTEPKNSPYDAEHRIFHEKFFDKTWDLIHGAKLAGKPLRDFGVPMNQLCGLSLMSILADCCAGSTRTRVTDRSLAYANVVGLLANQTKELVKDAVQPYEQLVPITLSVINTEVIDLKRLIAFREREAKSAGHAIRDLRHRYVSGLESYAERLATVAHDKSDRDEVKRQFEEDMKDDISSLRQELGFGRNEVAFSKEVIGTVVAAVGSIAAWKFGLPADLAGAFTTAGVPTTVFGGLSVRNKYQASRRAILQKHPMAYMFELQRSL